MSDVMIIFSVGCFLKWWYPIIHLFANLFAMETSHELYSKSKAYLLGKPSPWIHQGFCCGSRELLSGDAKGCFQPTERGPVGEVFQGQGWGWLRDDLRLLQLISYTTFCGWKATFKAWRLFVLAKKHI